MARKFATDIDLLKFSLMSAKAHPLSADPGGLGAGDEGLFWTNTTSHKFKFWNGTAVVDFTDLANSFGSLTAARISDFDTQVRLSRLDQLAVPTADLALNGRKITGLADGVAGTDGVAYGQLLALINNRGFKDPVRAATTANIASLAGGAPNILDGVTLAANDRVLVKDQTAAPTNGIYTVTTLGTGANGTWTRSTDADAAAELPPGSVLSVQEGTAGADKMFMLATNGPIVLGTTALVFSAYGTSTGEILTGGNGLVKTGTVMDVVGGTGIIANANDVAVDTARIPRKWRGVVPTTSSTVDTLPITITGSVIRFNHAAGHRMPQVMIRIGTAPPAGYAAGELIECTDLVIDTNNVDITVPTVIAANNYEFWVAA